MTIMADQTDKPTTTAELVDERKPGLRTLQGQNAVALAELLKLNLPSASWSLYDLDMWLDGYITRGLPTDPPGGRNPLQRAALQKWADHFGARITSTRREDGSEELSISLEAYGARIRVWTLIRPDADGEDAEIIGGLA